MLSPAIIKTKAQRLWNSGRLLRAWLGVEDLFPWSLPLGCPRGGRLLDEFASVRVWKEGVESGCKCAGGEGYRIEYREIEHRRLGSQRLPDRVVFDTPLDLVGYLGKARALGDFARSARAIRNRFPALKAWIDGSPMQVLEHRADWPRLLSVLEYFVLHPRPNLYIRELLIPGVDSKFIEGRKRLLAELLDWVLPDTALDLAITGLARHGFERRYGLRYDQPLIRLRLLDAVLSGGLGGLSDVSLPLDRFITLDPPCRRVFITENKVNGLTFPPVADSLVVFGLGYGVEALCQCAWLGQREILYWGDLDTHGFAILSQLRGLFPRVRSFLMDSATLDAGREAWVQEAVDKRYGGDPENLTAAERSLFRKLRDDRLGERVRLEQERIPFDRVLAAVQELNQ